MTLITNGKLELLCLFGSCPTKRFSLTDVSTRREEVVHLQAQLIRVRRIEPRDSVAAHLACSKVFSEQLESVVDVNRIPFLEKLKCLLGLCRLVPLDASQELCVCVCVCVCVWYSAV